MYEHFDNGVTCLQSNLNVPQHIIGNDIEIKAIESAY